jgi:twitching motility protein PilT
MVPNAAIRNLIREDKIHQIYSQMQVGQSRFSMQTMNQSLAALFQSGKISNENAFAKSNDLMELKQMLGQVS